MHPEKENRDLNYVMQLKANGLIDNAMVSFSTAGPGNPGSFAVFGGFDPNQIVGGTNGLHKM